MLPGIWESCTQQGKDILVKESGRDQDGDPRSWQVLETASRVGVAGAPELGAGKDEGGKAGWGQIGKGQDILLRQRGVMKDAMIKCTSLMFSLAIVWRETRRHPEDWLGGIAGDALV